MESDIEVQDPSTIMADDEETVEYAEGDGWHSEEVHRRNRFSVIAEKRAPPFGPFRISRRASHPAGDGSLGNIESKHQKLAMDSRRTPGLILRHHSEDQVSNFLRDPLSAGYSPCPRDRTPIQSESSPVPTDHGLRADDDEGLLPARPKRTCKNPEELIEHA
jgi:hypothetical protein